MTTRMKKVNKTLDKLEWTARKTARKSSPEKVVDSANDMAHSAAPRKIRKQTAKAGDKLIETGEKVRRMAK